MDRVVFIPFQQPYAHEFLERTNNWLLERPDKNFRVVVYNLMRSPLWGPNPMLLNLIKGSSIYIRGHGMPGVAQLTTHYRNDDISITIQKAIDRLIEMGLERDFRGTIKFYSCYSGLDQPPKLQHGTGTFSATKDGRIKGALRSPDGQLQLERGTFSPATKSLASVGAAYFRSLGFLQCKYYGYRGPLTGKYEPSDSSPDGRNHKWCELTTFDWLGDMQSVNATVKGVRASDPRARKSF